MRTRARQITSDWFVDPLYLQENTILFDFRMTTTPMRGRVESLNRVPIMTAHSDGCCQEPADLGLCLSVNPLVVLAFFRLLPHALPA